MKKINLDTWIQLIGMLSVFAGLLFVGLEMRQSQQIAIGTQQMARATMNTDAVNALMESGFNMQTMMDMWEGNIPVKDEYKLGLCNSRHSNTRAFTFTRCY